MPKSSRAATDDARQDVATERIGAEPVGGRWRLERELAAAGERVVGRDPGPNSASSTKPVNSRNATSVTGFSVAT
jgi:hypothetical protein